MVDWVSTGNLSARLCFSVTSEEICNLCQLDGNLRGKMESLWLRSVLGLYYHFILTEESNSLVSVGGRTWSYWPRSGFYKTMRTGQGWSWQLSWWQEHSFDSYPTLMLVRVFLWVVANKVGGGKGHLMFYYIERDWYYAFDGVLFLFH